MDRPGTHLHLDLLGGIAGDMFVAAVLNARPDLRDAAKEIARNIGPGIGLDLVEDRRKGIAGHRLELTLPSQKRGPRHYPQYVDLIHHAAPSEAVAMRAEDILRRLAEAEATVHGVPLEKVHFHEISDWDSIADILLAAWALEATGVTSASTSPAPLGFGRVNTEHGPLPVPAPATLFLLKGLAVFDDGEAGERITPTGAAILAHLQPSRWVPISTVSKIGHGLGTRDLKTVANLLRVSFCQTEASETADIVGEITFFVDDQSPEDLAIGLEHIRQHAAVLDVIQLAAQGKKGRLGMRIEILCRPDHLDDVIRRCFQETTTIGLRHRLSQRSVLKRERQVRTDNRHSKAVLRPDGQTTEKLEADHIADIATAKQREQIRQNSLPVEGT